MRRLGVALVSLALASGAAAAPQVDDDSLSVARVVEGLAIPTTLAFIGPNDFLVLEKNTGKVRRVTGGVLSPTAVLDLAVNGCDERGLLGIAVHPDFAALAPKPYVYLYYTASSGASDESDCDFLPDAKNNLDRFTWNGSTLGSRLALHQFPAYVSYHNGGPLAFGPDGKLYGVNGDNEQDGALQNFEFGSFFDDNSVIFRVNDDGTLPTDNPFDDDDSGSDPEDRYFAYGIRNSFGLAFDPETGDLWDTENGENEWDEINRVIPGANSGWRDKMGPGAAPAGLFELAGSTYIEPAYAIQSPVAVTGIAFPSAASTLGASFQNEVLVADYNEGQLYSFELNAMRSALDLADLAANNQSELDGFRVASGFTGGITDLKEGPDGALYVVAIALGEVWRISEEGGGSGPAHDFAITSVKPPKKVTFVDGSPPATRKPIKVSLVNQGSQTETIPDLDALDDLLEVTVSSLGGCVNPGYTVLPPKGGLPLVVPPRGKVALGLDVVWECVNDALATSKDADHADYTLEIAVDLEEDEDESDDTCPRAPSGDDKGCGKTVAGAPFRIDLVIK